MVRDEATYTLTVPTTLRRLPISFEATHVFHQWLDWVDEFALPFRALRPLLQGIVDDLVKVPICNMTHRYSMKAARNIDIDRRGRIAEVSRATLAGNAEVTIALQPKYKS